MIKEEFSSRENGRNQVEDIVINIQIHLESEKYLSLKTGVKHNTLANYNFVVNVLKKEEFSHKKVDDIKLSDAKKELARLKEAKKELDKNRFVTQKHAQITHESLIS